MRRYEMVSIDDLIPYENNARTHSKEQVEKIANSIQEFGFINPVLIDSDYGIIAGHGRVMGARHLGMSEVPCLFIEDLTEEQKRAYILADNKLALDAGWDDTILKMELEALAELDFDITLTGFDMSDIDVSVDDTKEVEEDDFDCTLTDEPTAKLGDIYQLGEHRLMCGDSTDRATIEKLMNGAKADMIYTDPPYGMNLDTDFSSMKNNLDFAKEKNFTGGKKYDQGKVDDFSPKMIETILELDVKETFLWGADYFAELLPEKNNGSWVVWDKRANGNDNIEEDYSSDKMYGSCFELCWSKKKHKRDIARVKWAGVFGTEQEFDHKRHHPTQKPIKLASWFLNRYSEQDSVVLDLFGGSGSTLIACEQLNRKAYIMELDPKYVDVIIKRWEEYTGQKAVKITEAEND